MGLLCKKGSYVGSGSDGGSLNVTGVGFRPKLVWIFAPNNSATYDAHRNPYFHSETALATIGGGVFRVGEANSGWFTSRDNITSVTNDGFTESYTATAAYKWLHFSGSLYPWVCLGGTDVISGSYVGNGADNRDVTGLGFDPIFVMIFSNANGQVGPFIKFATQPGDASSPMNTGGQGANSIQALITDGFQLGSSSTVNTNGVTYFYIAVKAGPQVIQGSYAGDNTDNRDIPLGSATFNPAFVIIKSRSGANAWSGSTLLAGDSTKIYLSLGYVADHIQIAGVNYFQVGPSINATGQTYDYIAFTERVGPETLARVDGSIVQEIATIDHVELKEIDSINSVT